MCAPILYHTAKNGIDPARMHIFVFVAVVGFLSLFDDQNSRWDLSFFLYHQSLDTIF